MLSPEQVRRRLGKLVTAALEEKSMSPEEFALEVDISSRSVRRIMSGNQSPLLSTLCDVLNALKIDPVNVFGAAEPKGSLFRGSKSRRWRTAMERKAA